MAITATVVTLALAATAAAVNNVASYQANKTASKTEARLAEANARRAMAEGRAAEATAAENARRQLVESRRQRSSARALYGASGVAMDSGSPLANLAQSAADAEGNALGTLLQGHHAMSSAMTSARMYEEQARVARKNSPRSWQLWAGVIDPLIVGAAVNGNKADTSALSNFASGMAGASK